MVYDEPASDKLLLTLMNSFKFPRTYADLEKAPWCSGYERVPRSPHDLNHDGCCIHVHADWVPDDYCGYMSAVGYTLKDALKDMRGLWYLHMRPPVVKAKS